MSRPGIGIMALLVVVLSVNGCKNSNPRGILSPETMQQVMWDMLRADELAMDQSARDTVRTNYLMHAVENYQQVFAVHNITKEEFYKSLRYYQERPDKNKELMDSIQAMGERSRRAFAVKDSLTQVKRLKEDSIRMKADSARMKTDSAMGKKDSLHRADSLRHRADSLKKADSVKRILPIAVTEKMKRGAVSPGAPARILQVERFKLRRDSLLKRRMITKP